MSFFSKGRTEGSLGESLQKLAGSVKNNHVAKRVDELGPSFLQMGDYSAKGITTWMQDNNVSQEEMVAMKPVIERTRELYKENAQETRQASDDEWIAGRRDRQGVVDTQQDEDRTTDINRQVKADKWVENRQVRQGELDLQSDEDRTITNQYAKDAHNQSTDTFNYNKGQRGKMTPLEQIQMLAAKARLMNEQNDFNGKPMTVAELKYLEENAKKDLTSQLAAKGIDVDPDSGTFVIPVNKEGMPDTETLKLIDRSGFSFNSGKKVMTDDKWGTNNEYGLEINLGAYKGAGNSDQGGYVPSGNSGDKPSASSFLPVPEKGQPSQGNGGRVSASEFLNKTNNTGEQDVSNISTMPQGDIKGMSETQGKDVYGREESYSAPESIGTKIQKLASKTQTGQKFGEGPIGYALRVAGIESDLAKQKEITGKLKEKYPKASEEEIAKFVLESAKGTAQK